MFFTYDLGKEMVILPFVISKQNVYTFAIRNSSFVISKHNVYPFAICNFRLAINKHYGYPFAIRNYFVCNF